MSKTLALSCITFLCAFNAITAGPDDAAAPNVVIIFADDMGYADIGCYGSRTKTPNLDRLAREGVRFTDFYVGQAVCSASRAALLTGCYPNRVGIFGALGPSSRVGIHSNEVTIAELLKTREYATAIFGKWHLGDSPPFLPTRHGFDEYFGLPYSNDMWPFHPVNPTNYPPLPLIEGERTIQLMPDQTQLTTWYTERAVKFIEKNKARPFFLYVAHNMPHVPLFVSGKHKNKSGRGLYADVVMEIDWSVGQIVKALKRHRLDKNTLVIFTSDNGPWLLYGDHAGSAGRLREGKATSFDGGVRVPCIMRWPGKIPKARICTELVATIDILPTVAKLVGANLPTDRIIDGKDISPLMFGERGSRSPHDAYFIYWARHLQAVRSGRWKLHFPHNYVHPSPSGSNSQPGKHVVKELGLGLYDLGVDPGETRDLSQQYPEVVARLQNLAEACREDLGDSAFKRTGKNTRPAGQAAKD
jgi:arylsulfatase A-like enzyme